MASRTKIWTGDSGIALRKISENFISAIVCSPPTGPDIVGESAPDTPTALWHIASERSCRLYTPLREAVRTLKPGGWFWVRPSWEEQAVIRLSLERLGLRYRTRLTHLFPPERRAVSHEEGKPDRMASLVTASSIWWGWQKPSSKADRTWLDGGPPLPRRPTDVFVETYTGIAGDHDILKPGTCAAFIAPKMAKEQTLGTDGRSSVRGPTGIDIARFLVRLCTEPGDRVLDPFCGSGGIVIGATLEDRACLGIEVQPDRADAARQRLAWWSEQEVLPLELTTLDRKMLGHRTPGKSLSVRIPKALKTEIENAGCSVPATIRSALCTFYKLPLVSSEHALPPGSLSPAVAEGKKVQVQVAIPQSIDLLGKKGNLKATALSALLFWCTHSEFDIPGADKRT